MEKSMNVQPPTSNSQDGRAPKNSLGVGRWLLGFVLAACCVIALLAQAPQAPPATAQQPSEIQLVISGEPGTPPRYAVPDFVALTPDAADIAKTLGQVLWDDLNFEREF